MEKGDRVDIIGGRKGRGKSGTVFWKGENKYGPGERYGVRGDDGETYWVVEDDVQRSETSAPPPPTDSRTYEKGDRVGFQQDGEQRFGSVFWTGKSRLGGQRLGIRREPDAETVWLDAFKVEPATGEAPQAPTGGGRMEDAEEGDGWLPDDYVQSGPSDAPPDIPFSDDLVDAWAPADEDDEPPPW